MGHSKILIEIGKARSGDELIRHDFISNHKPFIINAVSHICKRYITWSDEESSIGLLAFNRSIDAYEPNKGTEFLNFSYLLIKRDLISYFRSINKGIEDLSIDHELEDSCFKTFDVENSIQSHQKIISNEELIEEIMELETILSKYEIRFEELESFCPKHKETKELINKLVLEFTEDKELITELVKKKRFPTTEFLRKFKYPNKTIERFRKYIITLIIIKIHPEWIYLSGYIGIESKREEHLYA